MKNQNSLKNYILQICVEYRVYFLSLFAVSIIASLFEISVHYKIKEIIDDITTNQNANLNILLGLFVFFKFMNHGMFFIVRLLNLKYKPEFISKMTSGMYKKTINHSLHWFDSHMSGEIAGKINGFQMGMSDIVSTLFRSLVILWAIIIGVVFLFKVHYLSALVQLVFLFIYTPVIYLLLKKQLKLQESYEKSSQEIVGVVNDSISNIFGIKVIGNVVNEFKLKLTPVLLKKQEWGRITRRFDAFWVDNTDTLMIVTMSAAQIYLLSYLYQNDQISVGGFAFVAMIMLKVHSDINNLLDYILIK
ncbi:MAG: ATP-binding cassette subfamily B protein [Myxococcota bacterium]|jgi:ATP-binding cassette subfamily B protein